MGWKHKKHYYHRRKPFYKKGLFWIIIVVLLAAYVYAYPSVLDTIKEKIMQSKSYTDQACVELVPNTITYS